MAARQQMSSSRTMPQLNYTEVDIQEQYLSRPAQVRLNQQAQQSNRLQSCGNEQAVDQSQSVRWRRSQQLAKFDDNASDEQHAHQGPGGLAGGPVSSERLGGGSHGELDYDHNDERENDRWRTGRSRQPGDSGGPKRKRRSRSASRLLSACLHIPAQLASSISSHHHHHQSNQLPTAAASSQRTFKASSILSHFRIGHHHDRNQNSRDLNEENDQFHNQNELDYPKQRPLSSSRTLGDLQINAPSTDSAGSQMGGGRLKHVSFGENNQKPTQPAPTNVNATTRQETVINSIIQNQRLPNQTATLASATASARKQTHPDGGGLPTSQHQQAAITSSLPTGSPSRGRLHQPAPISRQPMSSTSLTSGNHAANFGHYHQQQQNREQLQEAVVRQPHQLTQSTVYKRLPSIPMRTQATQTEITAYHLMNSPSGLSSAGSCSLAGTMTRQQLCHTRNAQDGPVGPQEAPCSAVDVGESMAPLCWRTNTDTPTSSQTSATTTLAPATSASSNQTQPVISPQKSISNSSSERQDQCRNDSTSLLAQHEQNNPTAGLMIGLAGDDGDENEHDEDELEMGPSVQASLLQSSSNSSSSVSLVGHDSALADTLKCDLRIGAAAPMVQPVDETTRRSQRPTASETQSRRASIIEQATASSSVQAMTRQSGTTNDATTDQELNSCERPNEIEPPTKFKDDGQAAASETLTSTVAVDNQQRQQQQRLPSSALYTSSMADGSEHDAGEAVEEDEDEARTSPPSLSEASSQTDATMASSHMLDRIGRALERQAVKTDGNRRSSAADSLSQQQLQSRRRQISIDSGTMRTSSCQVGDTTPQASNNSTARMRALSQAPLEQDELAERQRRSSDSIERRLLREVAKPTNEMLTTRQTNCHKLDKAALETVEANANATTPKTLYLADSSAAASSGEPIRRTSGEEKLRHATDLPAEALLRRDQFLTSSQALSEAEFGESATGTALVELYEQNWPPVATETAPSFRRRLAAAAEVPQAESTPPNSIGAHRDDEQLEVDFMQVLDSDELLESATGELAGRLELDEQLAEQRRQLVEEHQQIQLAVSHAIVERVRKPSSTTTSTLSTRHHSYCSTDDFQTRADKRLDNDELEVDDVGPDCGSMKADKFVGVDLNDAAQLNEQEQQQQQQQQQKQSITMREARKESSSSLSSFVSDKQKDYESEPTSSSSATSGQTLKSSGVCGAGGGDLSGELQIELPVTETAPTNDDDARTGPAADENSAANGPNESGPTSGRQDSSQQQVGPANDLNDDDDQRKAHASSSTETTINLMAPNETTANKIQANDVERDGADQGQVRRRSVGVSLSSSCSNSFSSSASSSSPSSRSQSGPSKRSQELPKAGPSNRDRMESAASEEEPLKELELTSSLSRKASSPSPPTTVSDLDQDEELSTPSFVDTYKRRLEDHVNELADSFTSSLLGECLESVEIVSGGDTAAANRADEEPVQRGERKMAAQLRSSASVSSASSVSTTTTTTSVGGSSYVRLEDGQVTRRSTVKVQEVVQQQQHQPTPVAKPELPKKPAHLNGVLQQRESRQLEKEMGAIGSAHEVVEHCDERATAVAITASSIAAAAALHANSNNSNNVHQQSLPTAATSTMATNQKAEHQLQESEEALESQSSGTTTTSRQTQDSDKPLRVSSAQVFETRPDPGAGPLQSHSNAPQISHDADNGTQVALISTGHGADHNSSSSTCERQEQQLASPPPPSPPPPPVSAETEADSLMAALNGKQSPVDLSTLSEVSDEVSPSNSQRQQNSFGRTASGGHSEFDRSDSSLLDAQPKPASLIRQLSDSFDSRTPQAQSASSACTANANRAHRHSLSEQSSSQHQLPAKSGRSSANMQVRSPPSAVDCPYVATVTSGARISFEKKPALASKVANSSTPAAANGGNPLPLSLGAGASSTAAVVTASAATSSAPIPATSHHIVKRLSHDDTMEAIEDDVEGEEQEMKLLDELQQQRPLGQSSAAALANIAPPAAFCSGSHYPPLGSSRPSSSLSGPSPVSGQSIQEEDEDEALKEQAASDGQGDKRESRLSSHDLTTGQDSVSAERVGRNNGELNAGSSSADEDNEDDDDEESSISVSKEHGVVVESSSRPAARTSRSDNKETMKKSGVRMKRFKRSSSNSESSSASSSARATPVAVASSKPSTPTTSSATISTSDESTKTGSPVQRQRSDNDDDEDDHDQASEKSESQRELLIATPSSDHLEEPAKQQEASSGTAGDKQLLTGESQQQESASAVDKSASCLNNDRAGEQLPVDFKRDSTESATHAILEHLSRHQHPAIASAMALDEPALSLELCRSIDPQQRRASWRKESKTSRGTSSIQSPIHQQQQTSSAVLITTQLHPAAQTATSSEPQLGAAEESCLKPEAKSLRTRQTHQPQDSMELDEDRDDWTSPSNSPSRTGTMKRRKRRESEGGDRNKEAVSSALEPTQSVANVTADQVHKPETKIVAPPEPADRDQTGGQPQTPSSKRRPPLGELKSPATRANESHQQQSGSLDRADMDNSICSSCSCMETSFDQTIASREPMPQISEVAPSTSKQQRTSATASSSWMSQEEGTVFTENYWLSHWLYISEHEEAEIWRRAIDLDRPGSVQAQSRQQRTCQDNDQRQIGTRDDGASRAASQHIEAGLPEDMNETASTISERSFNTRYKSTTRKMIHRRASIEMFKRILANNLRKEKRVEISRSSVGEFGFRIHGSRPVVVSAIERGTSAETCGLQVGDLIYAINDTNILDMAHSDVVRLAHEAGSSALILDLIPTNSFLKTARYNRLENKRYEPTVTGYLMRLSPSTAQPLLIELQELMSSSGRGASSQQRAVELNKVMKLAWRARFFVLRSDNCLYWYRSPGDMVEPLGGLNLQGFSATLTDEFSEPDYVIRLVKYGGQPHYLGSNNMCDIQTWVDTINRAATEANQSDPYMRQTLILARCKPTQIEDPDCSGWLYKFSHKSGGGAHWRAAYFILKDACLYLFRNQKAELVDQASAVYYLHGYRVRSKHIEHKKHTFELIPPNRKTIKPMFLMASNEIDKRRWIAALEYSIDRWIEIN